MKLDFIQPVKPTQVAYVKSINGRFRDGCLNQNWFRSLEEAESVNERWQHEYNDVRPHNSLN